jgi:hypothetical protein
LKIKIIKLKKKQECRTPWLSHGACSYICVYIHAIAYIAAFCLQHDFYNTIFKIKQIIYSLKVHPPPSPRKNSGCAPALCAYHIYVYIL